MIRSAQLMHLRVRVRNSTFLIKIFRHVRFIENDVLPASLFISARGVHEVPLNPTVVSRTVVFTSVVALSGAALPCERFLDCVGLYVSMLPCTILWGGGAAAQKRGERAPNLRFQLTVCHDES